MLKTENIEFVTEINKLTERVKGLENNAIELRKEKKKNATLSEQNIEFKSQLEELKKIIERKTKEEGNLDMKIQMLKVENDNFKKENHNLQIYKRSTEKDLMQLRESLEKTKKDYEGASLRLTESELKNKKLEEDLGRKTEECFGVREQMKLKTSEIQVS
jgi:chromosome segregation ATPase